MNRRTAMKVLCGLLSLLPMACARTEQHTAAAYTQPQRWEYQVITLEENKERDLAQLMNTQGMQGWEYAGQLTGKDEHLVFKRLTTYRPYEQSTAIRSATAFGTIKYSATVPPRGATTVRPATDKIQEPEKPREQNNRD